MAIADLLVVGAGIGLALSSPLNRRPRPLVGVAAVAVLFVATGVLLPDPFRTVVKIVIVWAFILTVVRYPLILGGHSLEDATIDRTLRHHLGKVVAAGRRWETAQGPFREDAARRAVLTCDEAMAALGRLPRDNPRWRSTIVLVRAYIRTVESAVLPEDHRPEPGTPDGYGREAELRDAIEREWTAAIDRS